MRAAVVSVGTPPGWNEEAMIAARFVGALACAADVDVLVAEGPSMHVEADGATTRYTFPAAPTDEVHRAALDLIAFGPAPDALEGECGCKTAARRRMASELGSDISDAIVRSRGGTSPALIDHLQKEPYDLVVFDGYHHAATRDGIAAVAGRTATMLLPHARPTPQLSLPAYDEVFSGVDLVVVATPYERAVVAQRASDARVEDVGTVLRVHDLARRNEPLLFDKLPVVAVPGDWTHAAAPEGLLWLVRRLNATFAGRAVVRMVGPGWNHLPDDVRAAHADSRFDTWRWMVRSLAVWDPEPERLLGREALEALLYGTPIIARDNGGASRVHAESGDGGLWYRSVDDLAAIIELLLRDPTTTRALGEQGRQYAWSTYGSTDAYIERVAKIVKTTA